MQHSAPSEALAAPPLEPPHALPSDNNRRNGKVARLPKPIRDRINHMLEDGLTYANIVEQLGPDGRDLSLDNLSQWKKGGYQDWLRDHFWRVDMRFRQESFTDLLNSAEPIQLPEAGLQVAVTGICELLRDLCQNSNDRKNDSEKYVRVANSLARLSRSILQLQQYRDSVATQQAAKLKFLDHQRDFTGTEREGILDRADNLFGFKSARRLQAEPEQFLPPSNPVITAHEPPEPLPPPSVPSTGAERPGEEAPSAIPNPQISDPLPPAPPHQTKAHPDSPRQIPAQSGLPRQIPAQSGLSRRSAAKADSSRQSAAKADPSQISNPEILNFPHPPPACTLCTLRPNPWPPNPLPNHCLICAERPAVSQPP